MRGGHGYVSQGTARYAASATSHGARSASITTGTANVSVPLKTDTNTKSEKTTSMHDDVNHPDHYTSHPSGIECIQVTEWMDFNLGNAVKYIWRSGRKDTTSAQEDLRKAIWYLERECARLSTAPGPTSTARDPSFEQVAEKDSIYNP